MAKAKNLTDLDLKNLKPTDARREIPDGKVAGLYVIIQPSGAKSFAVRYRVAGKSRKLTIGPYPAVPLADARSTAMAALADVGRGNDPAKAKKEAKEERRRAADTVEAVVGEFIEKYARPNTRDWAETQRLLNKDIVPAWRDRRLSDITRADVHGLLDKIIARGAPVGANRTFAQLRKLCRWALQRGIIDADPCAGLVAPSAEKARDRVLSTKELGLVWRAAGSLGFPFGPIVQLLILTGQRRDEVAGARWAEIDLERRVWTIPAARAKNRRAHAVPLSAPAIQIIEGLPRFDGSDFLFSSGENPPSGFSKAKPRLDKAITKLNKDGPLPHFVLHDIRRSVASGMAAIGVDLHVIERCLNHVSGSFGGIVSVYQKHSYAEQMRDALDRWADHVEGVWKRLATR